MSSGLIGVSSGVLMEPYDRLVVGKIRDVVGDQYLLCFQNAVVNTCRSARAFIAEDPNEAIAYVFDSASALANTGKRAVC